MVKTERQRHRNPEKKQDRAYDTYDHFKRFGYILFPQQKAMYQNVGTQCVDYGVLEAGCGAGIGSAILERKASSFLATDVSARNVRFARELYPWMHVEVWSIKKPWHKDRSDIVVAIEVIEHVDNVEVALQNLMNAATECVWFSSPNGKGKPRPPDNSYHVFEYTPSEMLEMVPRAKIYHWKTMEELSVDTDVDPLLYKVAV